MDRYDGFEEFFDAHAAALSSTAFFLTGDLGDAEDLLQLALVKTVARWRQVAAGGSPAAYVRTVMLNQVRSRWRRTHRLAEYPTDALPDTPDRSDPEAQAIQNATLANVLRRLAPRQRAVLYLRFCEDLAETEIAELLGCRVGTVKRHIHDGVARLRNVAPELTAPHLTAENER